MCCSRAEEDCVAEGCSQKAVVMGALEEVATCMSMDVIDVLGFL